MLKNKENLALKMIISVVDLVAFTIIIQKGIMLKTARKMHTM